MFQNVLNSINTVFCNPPDSKGEKEKKLALEEEQREVESTKNENKLISILEKARALYIEKGLVGNINITSSFTIFYASVACDVDGVAEAHSKEELSSHPALLKTESSVDPNSSAFEKAAVSAVDKCVKMLERRAVAYSGKHYKSKLSLTNTIYAALPILSIVTISVSCTATVASLNAAAAAEAAEKERKLHEANLTIAENLLEIVDASLSSSGDHVNAPVEKASGEKTAIESVVEKAPTQNASIEKGSDSIQIKVSESHASS